MLWLCIHFPNLPLEALTTPSEEATIVVEGDDVLCCNDVAASHGVAPGQRLALAQELLGEEPWHSYERDRSKEQAQLQTLCLWAYSLTPTLELWHDHSLQLEIGGSLTLFKGLDALLDNVYKAMEHRGFTIRLGLSQTRKSAWLVSHLPDPSQRLEHTQSIDERIQALPLSLITDHKAIVHTLHRAGITTFGALLQIPSRALTKRTSVTFMRWLEELRGLQHEATRDFIPPPVFYDALWFGYELRQHQELIPFCTILLTSLQGALHNLQRQTNELQWRLLGQGETPLLTITVRSQQAGADTSTWLALTQLHMERMELPDNVEGLGLSVSQLDACAPMKTDLFDQGVYAEPLSQLTDRLCSRLGLDAVLYLGIRDEHIPEHTCYTTHGTLTCPDSALTSGSTAYLMRPFWLLQPPVSLRTKGGKPYWKGTLMLLEGPERIEDHWWRDATTRDYYVAQTTTGQPVWIYQDRHNYNWYLHGIFH
jgi:protein ImuB